MDEFAEFYAATQRRMLRALFALTGDREDAQDCLQEACVRAAARWPAVRRTASPEAWLRRVAFNLAFDGFRRRGAQRRAHVRHGQVGDEQIAGPDAASVDVVRAVRLLPREEQEVIVRHHLLDMTVADVAQDLGRPAGTVKAQLVRGRARLLAQLADHDERANAHD